MSVCVSDTAGLVIIKTAQSQLTLDLEQGRVTSLRNLATGEEYVCDLQAPGGPLLRLTGRGAGEEPARVRQFEFQGLSLRAGRPEGGHVQCYFTKVSDGQHAYDVCGAITFRTEPSGEILATLTLENASDLVIEEVLFPCIEHVQPGPDPASRVLVYPNHAGERIVNPAWEFAHHGFPHGPADITESGGAFVRELNYCGSASMLWMDYSGAQGGLYLASYDRESLTTGLHVETPGPEAGWLNFFFRKYLRIGRGDRWSSQYGIGIHSGDWHWGADRYREWAQSWLQRPFIPEWARQQPYMMVHYDFKTHKGIVHRFRDLPALFEEARREGISHLFISGWMRGGFDGDYPEYFPDMELGSPWELGEEVRKIVDAGGFITFYLNARIFNRCSVYFPTLGKAWSCKDRWGNDYPEHYTGEDFAVMCPACHGWRERIADYSAWLVHSFGLTGVYLDQVGSAPPKPCFDPQHEHASPGEFNRGYVELLREVRERTSQLKPDSTLMIEGCGDVYGQYVTWHLAWEGLPAIGPKYSYPAVFKYTFPQYMLVDMVYPRSAEVLARNPAPTPDVPAEDILYQHLLYGEVLWVNDYTMEDAAFWPEVQAVIRLRKELSPFMDQETSIFRDTLGVRVVSGAAQATRFDCRHASKPAVLVVVYNRSRQDGLKVQVELPRQPHEIWRYTLDGARVPVDGTGAGAGTAVVLPVLPDPITVYLFA